MTATAVRAHTSYRHEALLYRSEDDFLAGTVPFVREGLEADQPVMVAVAGRRFDLLRDALADVAGDVRFVDMAELGHNPARIIPGWGRFVEDRGGDGQPVRGIGEPIWAGRRPAEIAEGQFHEALLNLAVGPDTPLWLRCPYDVTALGDAVVAEAERSHPLLVETGDYRGSTAYGGAHHAGAFFGTDLREPPEPVEGLRFERADLPRIRQAVRRQALAAGLADERADDLALSVHEVAANSVRHAGGRGELRVWREDGVLVCEVRDVGRIADPLVGRRLPLAGRESGRGLWIANQLCDLVQIRSTPGGNVVRLLSWLT